MKKRKIKLLASLTSLVLVVAVMAVGVWAASTATVNITGNVSYNATGNVKATITLDQTLNSVALGTQQTAEFLGNETSSANTKSLQLGASNDGVVTLSQKEDDPSADIVYTYTVVIENNATESESNPNLTIVFTGTAEVNTNAPTKVAYSYSTSSTEGSWTNADANKTSTITIAPTETATIVFTLTQSANNTLGSTDIGAAITLTAAAE